MQQAAFDELGVDEWDRYDLNGNGDLYFNMLTREGTLMASGLYLFTVEGAGTTGATQTAQALALDAGLVPESERPAVLEALVELMQTRFRVEDYTWAREIADAIKDTFGRPIDVAVRGQMFSLPQIEGRTDHDPAGVT